jgi:uncharacterized membrane protein YfcA
LVRCGRGFEVARDTGERALATIALGGDLTSVIFVLAAAALAGFIDAMVGGGGLIQVPALLAAFPAEMPAVLLGTNKLASILGTASAVARYSRAVRIPWKLLLPAAAVALPAAFLGATLVSLVSAAAFRGLVPVILTMVLIYVLRHKNLGTLHAPIAPSPGGRRAAVGFTAAIGFYDGFFGPGTGSFLMLLFVRLFGFDFLHASAGARVVNVATNAGALLYFGLEGRVHWSLGLALGACNTAGSILGAHTVVRFGSRFVRRVFIVVVVALIAKTAWDAYRLLGNTVLR